MSKLSEDKIKWIGVTGLIGSGKSAVMKILEQFNYSVYSCDALVHEMYEDQTVIQAIQEILQENVITNEQLDRKKMAQIMFTNLEKKKQVESFVYPRLRELLYNKKQENQGMAFVEVPLLFECGWQDDYDEIWLVVAKPEIAKQRLVENRHMSEKQIEERLAHQMDPSLKIAACDVVIDNSSTLEALEKQIKEILYA